MGERPRISFHITKLEQGGAERVTWTIVQGLAERGADVELIVCEADPSTAARWSSEAPLVNLNVSSTFKSLGPLTQHLQSRNPDLLVTALHQPSSAAILLKLMGRIRTKVAVTIHNDLEQEARNHVSLNQRVMPFVVKRLYKKADLLICVSKEASAAADRFLKLPSGTVKTLYNPVVDQRFRREVTGRTGHPWLEDGSLPVILSLGRLVKAKAYSVLIKAFSAIAGKTDARLLIFGEGEERPSLEAMIREFGLEDRVQLPGFTSSPYPALRVARVYVQSSIQEGLPTGIIEALAAGCPVISSDCASGPKEILGDTGFGRLFPVGDSAALAEALLDELERPKVSPPPESWAPYTEERAIDRYVETLGALIGRPILE